MDEADRIIWAYRYRAYGDDDLRDVIARGLDSAGVAAEELTRRAPTASQPAAAPVSTNLEPSPAPIGSPAQHLPARR